MVDDVLCPERVLHPVLGELAEIIGGVPGDPMVFPRRILELWRDGSPPPNQVFDISLPQTGIAADTPLYTGPAVFGLLAAPDLLDLVEQVVGPEIYSNPVQHVRVKVPESLVEGDDQNSLVTSVPWHQDGGVLLEEADSANILTVWVPLNEATVENGCLQVIPGSHNRAEILQHCPGHPGGVAIPGECLPGGDPVPLPVSPGSVILMNQSTVHSSLPNRTADEVRVSLDLRYQAVGEPTGRPMFASAGFVARSRRSPQVVLRDSDGWAARWADVRRRMSDVETPRFNRWRADSPACA